MDPELGKFIDSGCYGKVYETLIEGKVYAVKVIDSIYSEGDGIVDLNFINTFSHPNLVRTYDFSLTEKGLKLVMEKVSTTLRDITEDPTRRLDFALSMKLIFELACVLRRIHDFGYVHGDLHSGQIGLHTSSMEVKLLDFSLSRHINAKRDKRIKEDIVDFIDIAMESVLGNFVDAEKSAKAFKELFLDKDDRRPEKVPREEYYLLLNSLHRLYSEFDLSSFLRSEVFSKYHLTCPVGIISPFRDELLSKIVPCPVEVFEESVLKSIRQFSKGSSIATLLAGVHLFYVCYSHIEASPVDLFKVCIFISNKNAFLVKVLPLDEPSDTDRILRDLLYYTHGVTRFETVYDFAPDNGVLLEALKLFLNPLTANVDMESLAAYSNGQKKMNYLGQLEFLLQ